MSATRFGRESRRNVRRASVLVALFAAGTMAAGCASRGPGEELGGLAGEVAGSAMGEKSIDPPSVGKEVGASAGRGVGEAVGAAADDAGDD